MYLYEVHARVGWLRRLDLLFISQQLEQLSHGQKWTHLI
jgi:hypothetical protein